MALTQEFSLFRDKYMAVHEKCQADLKHEKLKAYFLCMHEGFEFITADNVINEEKFKAKWALMHSEPETLEKLKKMFGEEGHSCRDLLGYATMRNDCCEGGLISQ
ncbi:unnamed protein product [Brassicogethes aeneus]|uniref:Uncharacterized protein n=1 Tax=Brassicogethes aeneus TaxID=1431903 RepID=A0A9P0FGY0_BRAAE|nr:unnamed protein product [Brassicogethes aeneus]